MDRPTSRAMAGTEASALRSSTASTRRVTAQSNATPRMSTLTQPTASSATKSASTSGTVSTRPTLAASARKPTSNIGTATSHRPQSSLSSVRSATSDNELKKDGTSTRPQRLSMAPRSATTVTAARPTSTRTTTSSTSGSTRPLSSSTNSTLRAGSTSPTVIRNIGQGSSTARAGTTTSSPRTTSSLSNRSKVAGTARSVAGVGDKKRLNNTPASPAARTAIKPGVSATNTSTVSSVKSARPPLGARKSTRSALLEQRIHDFELVQQMLNAAMNADEDIDPEQQEELDNAAVDTLEQLKMTLGRARQYEKEHGRTAQDEAELAEVSDQDVRRLVAETGDDLKERRNFSSSGSVSGDHTVREELDESRAYASQLEMQLQDANQKLKEFGMAVESESEKVEEESSEIAAKHANQMREMSSSNQKRLDHLRTIHREEMEELRLENEQKIQDLERDRAHEKAAKEEVVERLQAELDKAREQMAGLTTQAEEAARLLELNQGDLETVRTSSVATTGEKEARIAQLNAQVAELQAIVQTRNNELESATKSHAEELETLASSIQGKNDEVRELEEQVKSLTDQQQEAKKIYESDMEASQADLIKQLKIAQNSLAEVEADLSTARTKADSDESEALSKLGQDLKNAQNALTTATNEHERQIDELNSRHEDALSSAEASARAALQIHENTKTDLEIQLETARGQFQNAKKELLDLRATHVGELSEQSQKLKDEHSAKVQHLKDEHSSQLQKLESDSAAALASLEEIETAHQAKILGLQREAESEREEALSEQKEALTAALKDVDGQLNAVRQELSSKAEQLDNSQEELRTATEQHLVETQELKSNHKTELELALSNLRTEHEKQIDEFQTQARSSEAGSEKLQQLESENAQLQSSISSAQFQLNTIKSIMRDTEADAERARQEHEKEIAEKDEQFSKAVMKISQNSFAMMQKDDQHAKELASLKEEQSAGHEKLMQALRDEHELALGKLRQELETAAEEREQIAHKQHETSLAELNTLVDALEDEAGRTKDEHAKQLREAQENADKDNETVTKELTRMHEEKVETLKQEHAEDLRKVQQTTDEDKETVIKELTSRHEDNIKNCKEELRIEHEKEIATRIEAHEASVTEIRRQHEGSISTLQTQHESAITALKKEIEDLQIQHSMQEEEVSSDRANDKQGSEIADLQKALSETQADHAKAIEDLKASHQVETTRLSSELSKLAKLNEEAKSQHKSEHETSHQRIEKLEREARSVKAHHTREIQSIRNQHDEELVRAHHKAQEEVAAHEQLRKEAEAELAEARSTPLKGISTGTTPNLQQQPTYTPVLNHTRGLSAQARDFIPVAKINETIAQSESRSAAKSISSPRVSSGGLTSSRWADASDDEKENEPAPAKRQVQPLSKNTTPILSTPRSPALTQHASISNSPMLGLGVRTNGPLPAQHSHHHNESSNGSVQPPQRTYSPNPNPRANDADSPRETNGGSSYGTRNRNGRSNVQAQLAGINEDIRSLNDLSEIMLEENRRMARTLVRAESDITGINGSGNARNGRDVKMSGGVRNEARMIA